MVAGNPSPSYRFGDFAFRPRDGILARSGKEETLQPRVSQALEFLLQRPGRLVTREDLIAALWGDAFIQEGTLNQVISKLRRALGDDRDQPRYIETRFKRGYRFLADVAVEAAGEPDPSPDRRGRIAALGVASLLLLATVAVLGTVRLARRSPRPSRVPASLVATRLTFTPEREMEGSFSADGLSFAYVVNSPEEGQLDLFLASFAGGNRVRLTATAGDEFYPQFAPDGRAILFTRSDPTVSHTSIWRLSPLGGDERLVVPDGTYGTYSPDGAEIAYSRRAQGGWLVVRRRLADGRELELARSGRLPGSLAWSPDGRAVAFTDGSALWIAAAAGGESRQVGARAESLRSLAWDPSGESLLCDANWAGRANLWRVFVDGGKPQPLTSGSGGAHHPAASPRAGRVLYTQESQSRRLVLLDRSGRRERALPAKSSADCFDVDREGRRLVFADLDAGTNQSGLVVLDLDTGASRPLLVEDREAVGCPAFAPDGLRVAVVRQGRERPLWILDLAGAGAEAVDLVADGARLGRPAWTAAGTGLLVPADPAGQGPGLFEVSLGGGAWKRIAAGDFRSVAASPDGGAAAALGSGPEGGYGLYLVDLPTGRLRLLSEAASYVSPPIWARDGGEVLILTDERRRPALRRFAADGSRREPDVLLEPIPDPGFWAIPEVRPVAGRGWVALQVDFASDLFLLEPAAGDRNATGQPLVTTR
jgi:DNA-binding winged helix-turn-helix (wHTH) protein/Tol biopolymer transport system component